MTTNIDLLIKLLQFILGGSAVVAAFLLAQNDIELDPIVKVVLGAYLAFAAYANPTTLVTRMKAPPAPPEG